MTREALWKSQGVATAIAKTWMTNILEVEGIAILLSLTSLMASIQEIMGTCKVVSMIHYNNHSRSKIHNIHMAQAHVFHSCSSLRAATVLNDEALRWTRVQWNFLTLLGHGIKFLVIEDYILTRPAQEGSLTNVKSMWLSV